MPPRKRIAVLGSTGSVGQSVLAVAGAARDAFEVRSLSAFTSATLLAVQAEQFDVTRVAIGEEESAADAFPSGVDVLTGEGALEQLATDPDVDLVVNALVGAAGLRPTLAAARAGKHIALANKESLVMAGELLTRLAAENGGSIIPIDSEHSAILRCLSGTKPEEVARVVLTASGGPLRDLAVEETFDAGIKDVLNHPTWTMGEKITIDSATLFNKGMEVIEAHWLFGFPYDEISVVIHRESIVHSLVQLSDGSFLAHLGVPDMRIPIQVALYYPDAPPEALSECRLEDVGTLSFEPVDYDRYPCFGLIMAAAEEGGTAPAVAATADEVAVEAFLAGRIRFGDIAGVIEGTLAAVERGPACDLESVLSADASARAAGAGIVERIGRAEAGRVAPGRSSA